ncbi:hypothetical protein ACGYR1_29900, partial [Burkholderia pseudomallei]
QLKQPRPFSKIEMARRNQAGQAPRTTDEQKLLPVPCSRTTSWPDGTVGCGDYQSNGDYGKCLFRVGKKATGRMLDGRRHDEFPEVTR